MPHDEMFKRHTMFKIKIKRRLHEHDKMACQCIMRSSSYVKSHTGGSMTLGHGCIHNMSRKQKSNTKSGEELELVGGDDFVSPA